MAKETKINSEETGESPAVATAPPFAKGGKEGTRERTEVAYSAADLAAAALKRFKTSPEIVQAALKLAKKDKATIPEAEEIIKNFKERKIK